MRAEPDSGLVTTMVRFGEELRRWRYGAGLSQEAVAARVGVHQSTISRLERGRVLYTPAIVVARMWELLVIRRRRAP